MILVLISGLYAGLTSKIFFGFLGYDILLLLGLLGIFSRGIYFRKRTTITYLIMLLIFIRASYQGLYNDNEFLMSGVREWLVLIITIYVAIEISHYITVNDIQKAFNYSVVLVCILYIAIFFYKPLYYYYASVDHLEAMADQKNRFHGPNPIFITYLFVTLCLCKKNIIRNLVVFVLFTIYIYFFTQVRQKLVIMIC